MIARWRKRLERLHTEVRQHSPGEINELTDLAERHLSGAGARLRANLIPPLLREAPPWARGGWRADLLAGLTVAAITIPQAIAFALLIDIPVSSVVATSIVSTVICSLYCSSRQLVFGPTNTISIILAGALATPMGATLEPLHTVLLIGFLMGGIQIVASLGDLGKLTQFVSRAVIVGYTTAAGILIAFGQLGNLFGIVRGDDVSLTGIVWHLVTSFGTPNVNPVTGLMGCGSLALILALRRWFPKWPDGLPVLVIAGGLAYAFELDGYGVMLVRDLGGIDSGLSFFTSFPLNATGLKFIPQIASVALAAALLGILESVTIAKSIAAKTGQRIDPNQELLGMGLGNLIGACCNAMPGSASFLRSSSVQQAGGRSQWAVVIGSGGALLLVLLFSPLIGHLPIAAIAAYLVVIALRLIRPAQISIVRRSTATDAFVFWTTLTAALFLQLDTAIFAGIGLSLALFLKQAGAPSLVEHAFTAEGQLARIANPRARNHPQISIIHVEGDLFFGSADLFEDAVRSLTQDPLIRVFILRLKNARHLDATTVMAIDQLHEYLRRQNRHLLISGVEPDAAAVLERSGLAATIGAENIFRAEANPTIATKHALQRAHNLLGVKAELRLFYPASSAA